MISIMDPPSYGRGPKVKSGRLRIVSMILIKLCTKILSDEPLFFPDKFLYNRSGTGSSYLYVVY